MKEILRRGQFPLSSPYGDEHGLTGPLRLQRRQRPSVTRPICLI